MTGSAPLATVVVPCFNQAHFLPEALDSIRRQTYPAIETIVVDDGSRDDTTAVAARHPGVRCLRQPNRGLAEARNAGLRASRGRYVVFLDADDRLLPGALGTGVDALERDPAYGFVFGHHRRIDSRGRSLRTPVEPCAEADAYAALLRMNYISMPAKVMFRRSVLDACGGFATDNPAAADYDLYLRISRRFPIACHHADVAEYRQHDAAMTRNAVLMLRATLGALRSQRAFVRDHPGYRAAYREGIAFARAYYATRLADDVRRRAGARRWGAAFVALSVMARHCPRRLVGALVRAGVRTVLDDARVVTS